MSEKKVISKTKKTSDFIRIGDTMIQRFSFTKVEEKDGKCIFTNCGHEMATVVCTLDDVEKVLN